MEQYREKKQSKNDKAKKTFEKYGKNTSKGLRIKIDKIENNVKKHQM